MVRSTRFSSSRVAVRTRGQNQPRRQVQPRHAPVVLVGHDFEVRRASPVPKQLTRPLEMFSFNYSTSHPPCRSFRIEICPRNCSQPPPPPRTTSSSAANATGKDSCYRLTRGGEHNSRNLRALPLRRVCCNRLEHGTTHRHLTSHRPPTATATV